MKFVVLLVATFVQLSIAEVEFELLYEANKVIGIYNDQRQTALAIDFSCGGAGAFSGTKKLGIFFDLQKNEYYVTEIEYPSEDLKNYSSFCDLVEKKGLEGKNADQMDDDTLAKFGEIEGTGKAPEIAVQEFVALGKNITDYLNNDLKGLVPHTGKTAINKNVVVLLAFEEPLGELFKVVDGGLPKLAESDFEFDLTYLMSSSSGVDYYSKVLAEVGKKFDIAETFGQAILDPKTQLGYLKTFTYNVPEGIDGLFILLCNFVNGDTADEDDIKKRWEQSQTYGSVSDDLDTLLKKMSDLTYQQWDAFKNQDALKGFSDFFQNIKDKKLTIDGKDVSQKIEDLGITVQ